MVDRQKAVDELYRMLRAKYTYRGLVPEITAWGDVFDNCQSAVDRLMIDDFNGAFAYDIFSQLYSSTPLTRVPGEWWHTELGKLLAKHFAQLNLRLTVTQAYAAAMLGRTPGTVATLAHDGEFERGERGKLLFTSVLRRMLRMETTRAG